ncbi:MAG TPA: PhoU domain-containing protein [Phycisphaerae bacterium]|nr:PhoU domain-containing protein [Phycisphaerae bacterium]HPS53549.1 PhoU domain-containing protein [Phycisphaerae bacterium]
MFKEIINAFRNRDVVREMSQRIGTMLDSGKWMLEQASNVLLRKDDWNAVADNLYKKDKEINAIERDIREQIITHLSLSVVGQANVIPCLVLMSVVKDAERIGDYCKNIFEVGKFYRDPYRHREFIEPLEEIRTTLVNLFDPVKDAFINNREDVADACIKKTAEIARKCDMIIQQLLSMQGNFDADEAVAYVLMARHYKRVSSHLGNIATSVVSAVPLIDFRHN